MDYRKVYTPLCNKHIRFYFSNPYRSEFKDYIAKKQFNAVKKVLSKQSEENIALLKKYVAHKKTRGDLFDDYIENNIKNSGCSKKCAEYFFRLLYKINRSIAVELGYIPCPQEEVEWHCDW